MSKLKPILITALISILAVYVYNTFIAPKVGTPTA